MRIDQAKAIARQWILEHGAEIPGIEGVFIHGSGASLPDDADLPATSDFDLMVVIGGPMPEQKLGKFRYRDLLLEVSYLASDEVESARQVLGLYHLAGSFRANGVLFDPSGRLTQLQREVAREFAREQWVIRRCEHARDRLLTGFPLDPAAPFPDQVISWLFPTGVLTHILLVAGLKNPTVRTRYLAVRQLLEEYELADFYPVLLALLGADLISGEQTKHHLDALERQFDAAAAIVSPAYPFAADLSETGKVVAIGGSRDLIEQGNHREALFWMLATACRCQHVFRRDGTLEIQKRFDPPFRQFLAALGISSTTDLKRRRDDTVRAVPRVWDIAKTIIAENPDIER